MGARIALKLAVDNPTLVARLILADPPVSGPFRRPYPIPLKKYLDTIDSFSSGAPADGGIYDAAQNRLRSEWIPTCDRTAIIETYANFGMEDIFPLMPRIRASTLLLYAGLGDTIRDNEAQEISRIISPLVIRKLENVGHMMPWFDLDLFLQSIEAFIKSACGTC
jgi:N-formylmaleamate deformylase